VDYRERRGGGAGKDQAECKPTNDAEADAKTIRFTIGRAFRGQMMYEKKLN
jgi:hypothetical protein